MPSYQITTLFVLIRVTLWSRDAPCPGLTLTCSLTLITLTAFFSTLTFWIWFSCFILSHPAYATLWLPPQLQHFGWTPSPHFPYLWSPPHWAHLLFSLQFFARSPNLWQLKHLRGFRHCSNQFCQQTPLPSVLSPWSTSPTNKTPSSPHSITSFQNQSHLRSCDNISPTLSVTFWQHPLMREEWVFPNWLEEILLVSILLLSQFAWE